MFFVVVFFYIFVKETNKDMNTTEFDYNGIEVTVGYDHQREEGYMGGASEHYLPESFEILEVYTLDSKTNIIDLIDYDSFEDAFYEWITEG